MTSAAQGHIESARTQQRAYESERKRRLTMWKLRRSIRVKVEIAAWRWFGVDLG
jgi:hypothetical protein